MVMMRLAAEQCWLCKVVDQAGGVMVLLDSLYDFVDQSGPESMSCEQAPKRIIISC